MCVPSLRKLVRVAAFMVLGMLGALAHAQQYPNKPIRLLVPFAAGGAVDPLARALAVSMQQTLGQPVVVDNKPGADGTIAAGMLATSPPDGYTILLATGGAFSYAPAARKSLPYDPIADFTPIGSAAEFGYFIYVHPAVPARNLHEFLDYVRANPGKVNHGASSGVGQLFASSLARTQKLQIEQIPYKGDSPMAVDLLSGRVQFAVTTASLVPHVKEGKLRLLAAFLPERNGLLPDVPTVVEAGIQPLDITLWCGLLGPAKLPPAITKQLAHALTVALGKPEVREQITKLGAQVRPGSGEELGATMRRQLPIWRKEVQAAGIQPE
jgi:tripartite-type tricarboxylate transporter receptor subunit TctC